MTAPNFSPSTHDLTDSLIAAQAEAALHKAEQAGPEALAAWATEWAQPAMTAIRAAIEGERGYFED